ncbi:MAG: hypothetical protein ACLQVG_16290, partial [Terriglobia bacterium]
SARLAHQPRGFSLSFVEEPRTSRTGPRYTCLLSGRAHRNIPGQSRQSPCGREVPQDRKAGPALRSYADPVCG